MGDTAYIFAPENCDFCKTDGKEVEAKYDGKTVHGPWAYMCEEHFGAMGVGLGTGRGQRLIVGERPKDQPYTEDGDIDEFPLPSEETTPENDVSEEGKTSPEKSNGIRPPQTDWGNLYP